jgi:copper chaperone CopZ
MDKTKKILKVKGMHCTSCASLLECELEDAGIEAKVNFAQETVEIKWEDETKVRSGKFSYQII